MPVILRAPITQSYEIPTYTHHTEYHSKILEDFFTICIPKEVQNLIKELNPMQNGGNKIEEAKLTEEIPSSTRITGERQHSDARITGTPLILRTS